MGMNVPSGYKQTKVGVIPEDWDVVKLGDTFDFIKTYSNSRSHLSDVGDLEYMHYGDIHTKYKFHIDLNKVTLPKISQDNIKGDIVYVQEGDLIIADASEDYTDIGKSVEVTNLGDRKVISGLHTFLLRDNANNFSHGYKGLLLYNQIVSKEIKKIATGISVLGISKTNLGKLLVPLPPLKEQQKIAQILSTWDNAITKQEELIKAKEELKQGLMQKLFSGKVRFDGFNGEWKEVRLDKVLFHKVRAVDKPKEGYWRLGLRSHAKGTFHAFVEDPSTVSMDTLYDVKENDLIVNITFAWEHALALASKSDEGKLVSHRFPTYVFISQHDPLFFKYYMLQPRFKYELINISPGGAGRNRVMSKKDFLKLKVIVPAIEEQQKIAQVLTLADKEIELLKEELEALKDQKRGLMQRLLSGEVRTHIIKEKND